MVKAIWAVACSILVLLVVTIVLALPASAEDTAGIAGVSRTGPAPMDNSVSVQRPAYTPRRAQNDTSYRLGPEDQLRISVWDNKDLTLDLVVRPDGKISMPLIQDVPAEGLTAAQLADEIQRKLTAYIVNPEVSVIVLQVNAPKYYLIGYVARPGTYPLRGDTSVLQALALAGGLTQFASPKKIKLIRAMNGRQEVRTINYYNLIEDGGEGNYLLKSGDTIVVP
jgi:polysaccharide export outer membrane protein